MTHKSLAFIKESIWWLTLFRWFEATSLATTCACPSWSRSQVIVIPSLWFLGNETYSDPFWGLFELKLAQMPQENGKQSLVALQGLRNLKASKFEMQLQMFLRGPCWGEKIWIPLVKQFKPASQCLDWSKMWLLVPLSIKLQWGIKSHCRVAVQVWFQPLRNYTWTAPLQSLWCFSRLGSHTHAMQGRVAARKRSDWW